MLKLMILGGQLILWKDEIFLRFISAMSFQNMVSCRCCGVANISSRKRCEWLGTDRDLKVALSEYAPESQVVAGVGCGPVSI